MNQPLPGFPGAPWKIYDRMQTYDRAFEIGSWTKMMSLARRLSRLWWMAGFCLLSLLGALAAEKPPGLDQRVPWTTSRLAGSPDPPAPYMVERTLTNLVLKSPLYLAPEPGTENLFVIDRAADDPAPWQVRRMRNEPAAVNSELLLAVTNRQLYGLTFHPNYASNGFVYLFHNGPTDKPERTNRISRFTVARQSPRLWDPSSELVVIEWRSAGHDGGDLAFGADGMLYITSGDGTSDSDVWDSGQDVTNLLAALLRLDVDNPPPGKTYAVPQDNPLFNVAGARREIWAYGFRNPWRMDIDEKTGDIWVGNNGQDLWETAHLVRRGDNFGWSVYEGSHPFYPNRRRGPTPIVAPTIEHSHADFRSLTGGVVYHGAELPELNGVYIYGDYSTGKIWGARHRQGQLEWHRELVDTTLQIVCFRVDQHGQLLVLDHAGGVYRLVPRPPKTQTTKFPTRLSETGLFASTKEHRVAAGIIPYDVNASGWMDGAVAERFIALPGDIRIGYTPTRGWNFTNGSALVQTIWVPSVANKSETRRRIETRVFLKHEGEWAGYSYRWNDEQTDAVLVPKNGGDIDIRIRDAAGATHRQSWRIPSRAECLACHSRAVNFVLGLSEPQMNRTFDYGAGVENQLTALDRIGVLSDAPKKQPDSLVKLVNPYDEGETLDHRARSYLHANCSVCHVEAGGGNAKMELEFTRAREAMNLFGARPQHDTFGVPNAMLLAPGEPDRSVLVHRVSRRGRGQMPPLVTALVDQRAVSLFRRWIAAMPPDGNVVREWTTGDLLPALGQLDAERSLARGKAALEKVGCVQCHRFAGEGGSVGPDLTGVGRRFDRRGLLESILEPSKLIADEYASHEIEKRDGERITGRIEREDSAELFMRTGSAVDELVRIRKSDVRRRTKSSVSNMPSGMVNVLEQDQILDLLAYLLKDGAGN